MGSTRGLVKVGRVDLTYVIAHHMVVQSLLLIHNRMHTYILHLKVTLLILHKHDLHHSQVYLCPTLKVVLRVVLIKQVVCALVVDLNEGYLKLIADLL